MRIERAYREAQAATGLKQCRPVRALVARPNPDELVWNSGVEGNWLKRFSVQRKMAIVAPGKSARSTDCHGYPVWFAAERDISSAYGWTALCGGIPSRRGRNASPRD
jgi:hypothetical protein